MAKRLFVVGTGTDVGKTFISGRIVKQLHEAGARVGYFKAAMSGNVRDGQGRLIPGDAVSVKTASGIDQAIQSMCPYVYEAAVSPHLAAQLEGNPVSLEGVKRAFDVVDRAYDYVVIEGSGGIFCPLRFHASERRSALFLEDVIAMLKAPCILVADAGLGTINAVVLTASYMKARGMSLRGIVLNHFHPGDALEADNLRMCEYMTGYKVLTCVSADMTSLDMEADALMALFSQ